jgi:hypothetical protein
MISEVNVSTYLFFDKNWHFGVDDNFLGLSKAGFVILIKTYLDPLLELWNPTC